ncbi:C6 zinc finger domain protein [Colletotrichum musicola]|uniref:C6 zinc finger domain protein n=1 Tax=Colletotrichum musicola TaxID=2175873 RepID=A0A8H6N1K5_9PEZI|nr:C6 zinc finger domain protein [Colletotrichum musicola]
MSERVIRRRNVTTRDRTGCVTCRARRLKCDEGKPKCHNCTRLNLECGGYVTPLKFKDQSDLWRRKQARKRGEKAGASSAIGQTASSPGPIRDREEREFGSPQDSHMPEVAVVTGDDTFFSADDTQAVFDGSQELSLYEAATSLALISERIPREELQQNVVNTNDDSHLLPICTGGHTIPTTADATISPETFADHVANDSPREVPFPYCTAIYQPQVSSRAWDHHADESTNQPTSVSVPDIPAGLLESAKFPEDMIYYHHLRDPSPYGILSILSLEDILQAEHLDSAFFHAALALSALDISQFNPPGGLASKAALQALDHFVAALGTVRMAQLDDDGVATGGPQNQDKAISWLATVLLLANFELQRGQMKLWYVHGRAAVAFLSQHLARVRESPAGESLIRSFSRIAAFLDIFDRAYSVKYSIASAEVSESLAASLAGSPQSADRLLRIIPRVIKLEEEWRSNPQHDLRWRSQAEELIRELKEWRATLDERDVPPLHEHTANPYEAGEGPGIAIRPLVIPRAQDPVKAATTFMHYLISLLRLETRYLPGAGRELPPDAGPIVLLVCRLAAGVPRAACAAANAYGHGMLPAMMNAYYMSEDPAVKDWVRGWIAGFPREREGIWHVRRARRVLSYVDKEYNRRGSRHNWEIIKVRMVDLEDDATPREGEEDEEGDDDRFSVEVYSRCKRGWSIDFVEIP